MHEFDIIIWREKKGRHNISITQITQLNEAPKNALWEKIIQRMFFEWRGLFAQIEGPEYIDLLPSELTPIRVQYFKEEVFHPGGGKR